MVTGRVGLSLEGWRLGLCACEVCYHDLETDVCPFFL